MHLENYVRQVHDQLAAAAALGDERTQQIATNLASATAGAVRLAVLAALSDAAEEITAALLDSPGAPRVSVRLDGADADEARVEVVDSGTSTQPGPAASRPEGTHGNDANARISLRLPESLKADVEQAAAREGVSVNAWLVRAAEAAMTGPWTHWPGPGFGAGFGSAGRASGGRRGSNAHHVTGWING